MKKPKLTEGLTPMQLQAANDLDKALEDLKNIKHQLQDYKLNDVYIIEEWDPESKKNISVEKTNMGFPVKYKVVHISTEGIPYLRKITPNGNPTGPFHTPPEAAGLNWLKQTCNIFNDYRISYSASANYPRLSQDWRFTLDPEQLDSILLQQEFDPMAQQREKSKLFNEINKHNKRIQVSSSFADHPKTLEFFKSRQPGDKFWTSPDQQYVVQSVTKPNKEYVVTCTDMNQKTIEYKVGYFYGRRLYRECPRSFAKESKE